MKSKSASAKTFYPKLDKPKENGSAKDMRKTESPTSTTALKKIPSRVYPHLP